MWGKASSPLSVLEALQVKVRPRPCPARPGQGSGHVWEWLAGCRQPGCSHSDVSCVDKSAHDSHICAPLTRRMDSFLENLCPLLFPFYSPSHRPLGRSAGRSPCALSQVETAHGENRLENLHLCYYLVTCPGHAAPFNHYKYLRDANINAAKGHMLQFGFQMGASLKSPALENATPCGDWGSQQHSQRRDLEGLGHREGAQRAVLLASWAPRLVTTVNMATRQHHSAGPEAAHTENVHCHPPQPNPTCPLSSLRSPYTVG